MPRPPRDPSRRRPRLVRTALIAATCFVALASAHAGLRHWKRAVAELQAEEASRRAGASEATPASSSAR